MKTNTTTRYYVHSWPSTIAGTVAAGGPLLC